MSAKFDAGRMFTFLKGYALGADMPNTLKALVFARKAHADQTRKSGEPYIVHPLTMACHAITLGIDDDDIVAACLLHDVVEDTGYAVTELPVNDGIKDAVNRLTHEKGEPLGPYYRLIAQNHVSAVVKLLDRCDNVSTMAGVFTRAKCLDYIQETRDYVLPLLRTVKEDWPEYSDLAFVLKYHILSVIDGLDACLKADILPAQDLTPDETAARDNIIMLAQKAADEWRGTDGHCQAAAIIDSLLAELRRGVPEA